MRSACSTRGPAVARGRSPTSTAGVARAACVAARFHDAMAEATAPGLRRGGVGAAATEVVVLSGGVFQNRRLLEAHARLWTRRGCAC